MVNGEIIGLMLQKSSGRKIYSMETKLKEFYMKN